MPATLRGCRRVWGVATDNIRALPGGKMYLRRSDGVRPAVYVAFLDLEPDPARAVEGLVLAVTAAELRELDLREGNYDRVEVSERIEMGEPAAGGPALDPEIGSARRIWTYVGSAPGRARLRRGRSEGCAVVSRDYLDRVRRGFALLGPDAEQAFVSSTDLDALPVLDLDRVDLSPGAPPARVLPDLDRAPRAGKPPAR